VLGDRRRVRTAAGDVDVACLIGHDKRRYVAADRVAAGVMLQPTDAQRAAGESGSEDSGSEDSGRERQAGNPQTAPGSR